jgi:hypothetical protein
MTCGVVATSISGCVLRAVLCRTQHGTQYTHHSLKYLLPQRRISCSFTDQFHNIVTLARLSIRSLMMVQLGRNM